jgi:hypothetical protein
MNASLANLRPADLRHLAAAIEARSPEAKARRDLAPEGIERLADIYLSGSSPTVGFFKRFRKPAP